MKIFFLLLLPILFFENSLNIMDTYHLGHAFIAYGSYMEDAYVMIGDVRSEEVYNEIIVDEGSIESFVYLAEVRHHEFILVLKKYSEETDLYQYSLLLFNTYGEVLNRLDLIEQPIEFYNHHQTLILETKEGYTYVKRDLILLNSLSLETDVTGAYQAQFQGKAYINHALVDDIKIDEPGIYEISIIDGSYEFQETITIHPLIEIYGDHYQAAYIGDVVIESKGKITMNGKAYESGQPITRPGTYEVYILGVNHYKHSFDFKILPLLYYFDGEDQFRLEDGMVFDFPIRLYSNTDVLNVNGDEYEGDLLTKTGDYFIELWVNDKIIDTINISLVSRVDGVENKGTYQEASLYAFGDVYLNGEKISGFHHVKDEGRYQITLKNQDENFEEIEFYIQAMTKEEKPPLFPYGILIISLLGFIIFLFKK